MRFIVIILILIGSPVLAQFSTVKRVLDNIEDGDVNKAYELLTRAIEKDSLDPGIQYAFSRLYDSPLYERANPDSAYFFIQGARREYLNLDGKELDKLKRSGIDSILLEGQKSLLDSQAYEAVQKINTVVAYQEFMLKYPTSAQYTNAILKEHDAAYHVAKTIDTYEGYQDYMYSYPKSTHYQKSLDRFEELYFYGQTKDGKLNSYKQFLELRPESPFRSVAEKNIFEISTAGNRISDVKGFLRIARSKQVRRKALDILYHVLKEKNSLELFEQEWQGDSLKQVESIDLEPLFPIITNGRYDLINSSGNRVAEQPFDSIFQEYLCNPIVSDIIITVNSLDAIIKNRGGTLVWEGRADEIMDLGYGIIKVGNKGKYGVIHKRGEQILPFIYEDIKQVEGSFLATKRSGKWGLVSYTGKQILPNDFSEILPLNGSIVIRDESKIAISNVNSLKTGADGNDPQLVLIYDEYEAWPDQKIWVKSANSEGLINQFSSFDIPLFEQEIVSTKFGYLSYGKENSYLDIDFRKIVEGWDKIQLTNSFGKVESGQNIFLLNIKSGSVHPFDSVTLWGDSFAVTRKGEMTQLIFSNQMKKPIGSEEKLSLLRSEESEYLLLTLNEVKYVYNELGELIYKNEFDEIKPIGKEYFVIKSKGKEGLISSSGKTLLPSVYDAFGGYEEGGISVLKKGKLGYFHLKDSVWIKPTFDRKVVDTRNGWFVVDKDNVKRIADPSGSLIEGFEFREVFAWNDSSYLVLLDDGYAFFNPSAEELSHRGLEEVKLASMDSTGLVIRSKDGFGIIHPDRAMIVPPIYTFLTRIGNLIKAEKYIKEADYYLMAYYNLDGELIYRDGLTPEENEKLFCDN